jgi:hypothetical protein
MNKHIELVKKWLAENDSVSQTELHDNRDSAYQAFNAADANISSNNYLRELAAAEAAAEAAADAADAAVAAAEVAESWVSLYEDITK